MQIRIWLANDDEKSALAQAYAAYTDELLPDGAPHLPDTYFERYWQEPDIRFPYLFGLTSPQGFAFVRYPEEPEIDVEMAEFCVAKSNRRTGVGTSILPVLFAKHPGRWEISILQTNATGLAFWPEALRAAGVQKLRYLEEDHARTYRFTTA